MPRVEGDFAALLHAVAIGGDFAAPSLSPKHGMAVILAASGYPGAPRKGGTIANLDAAEAVDGVTIFHAGTARNADKLIASGGRVLAVTALGMDLRRAHDRAYQAVDAIDFADGFCRRDIGWRELERTP